MRDGVRGLRAGHYTYHMPAFGPDAYAVVEALAEGDGELPADPTLGPLAGRVRRDWFEHYLDGPARSHPGTPMPAISVAAAAGAR